MPWFRKIFSSKPAYLKPAVAETRGQRQYMEDRHIVTEKLPQFPDIALFAVFDGHGGTRASQFAKETFVDLLCQNLLSQNFAHSTTSQLFILEKALHASFLALDKNFMSKFVGVRDGSTALVALIWTPPQTQAQVDSKTRPRSHVVVANTGDCRAVASRSGKVVVLSNDHKPDRPDEKRRILRAGGVVSFDQKGNVWRVEDMLAVSRSIGDAPLKKYVIPDPEIQKLELGAQDEFLLLASDGFWDVFQDQEAVDWIGERLDKGATSFPQLADDLVQEAEERGSMDNITTILVKICV